MSSLKRSKIETSTYFDPSRVPPEVWVDLVLANDFSLSDLLHFGLTCQYLAQILAHPMIQNLKFTRKKTGAYLGHQGRLVEVKWSPDSVTLGSCGDDGTIRLWNTRNGAVRMMHGHPPPVWSIAFHPTRTWLASGGPDGGVRIWDISPAIGNFDSKKIPETSNVQQTQMSHINNQNPNNNKIPDQKNTNTNALQKNNSASQNPNTNNNTNNNNNNNNYHNNNNNNNNNNNKTNNNNTKELTVPLHILCESPPRKTFCLQWNSVGNILAAGSDSGEISLWDSYWPTPQLLRVLRGPPSRTLSLAFSPCGLNLARCGYTGRVSVFEVQTGYITAQYEIGSTAGFCVAYSCDGTKLMCVSSGNRAHVWQVAKKGHDFDKDLSEKNQQNQKNEMNQQNQKNEMNQQNQKNEMNQQNQQNEMNQQNQKNVQNEQNIQNEKRVQNETDMQKSPSEPKKWEIEVHRPFGGCFLKSLLGEREREGRVALTSGNDVVVCEVESGSILNILKGHTDSVEYVALSPDGSFLATCSFDSSVRVWDLTSECSD